MNLTLLSQQLVHLHLEHQVSSNHRNKGFVGALLRIMCLKLCGTLNDLLYLYCISNIPTSIDDQANHIKRKSNLIFGEAATTGLLKRKDERDITRISDLKNKRMTDK